MREAYQRALAAFQVGRYDLCEQCVKDALIDDPNDVDLVVLLAHCKLATDQYVATRAIAKDAIRIDPEDGRGFYLLAWATISDALYEPLDPITGRKPQDLVVASEARLRIASDLVERCLEISPDHAPYYSLRAEIERLRGNDAEALKATSRGLALNPEDGPCSRTRVRILSGMQRFDEALQVALQRLRVEPEDGETHELSAELYLRRRDLEHALPHARQAVRLGPTDSDRRRLYWDCVKARHWFYRPFVYWRYLTQWIQSIPSVLRVFAFAVTVLVGGGLAVYVNHRSDMASAPILIILGIGLLVLLFSAERPCMLIVDLVMFATDPDFRLSVDRRQLAIDTGLAIFAVFTVISIVCMAMEIFAPILVLLGSVVAAPSLFFIARVSSRAARIGFVLNLLLLMIFGWLTVELFSNSLPGSRQRIYSFYAFLGFLFVGITGPAIYAEKLAKRL